VEFKISPDKASIRKHDQHIRLFLWSAVLLLLAITIIGIAGTGSIGRAGDTALVAAAAAIVIFVVGAAYVLAGQDGIEREKRNMTFLLSNEDLVRQRPGWPDVRIGLSEVRSLSERRGSLVVESVEPRRRIAIPNNVESFEFLRSELLKHGPMVSSPRQSPFIAVPTVVSLVCWALVFWSKDPRVVKTAACVAVVLFAWGSFHIGRLRIPTPKRYLTWAMLAATWVVALWIIYSRLAGL
jgi:hypothetical protein